MTKSHGLSAAEVAEYERRGYAGPFDLVSRDEALAIGRLVKSRRPSFVQSLLRYDPQSERHFELSELLSLCLRSEALDRIESLLGPNILLWRTRVFSKAPGETPYAFHQDAAFWNMQDARSKPHSDARHLGLSIWVAFDDTDRVNGCVEVLPGSHGSLLPHSPEGWLFGRSIAPEVVSHVQAVPMVMKAGQFFLFHNFMAHRSGANTTSRPRAGFSARFTVPGVAIRSTGHRFRTRPVTFLLRGEDAYRANPIRDPRPAA
jgi:non-heme Fe2+,alpha-ketoglutarate-dependent halogenase